MLAMLWPSASPPPCLFLVCVSLSTVSLSLISRLGWAPTWLSPFRRSTHTYSYHLWGPTRAGFYQWRQRPVWYRTTSVVYQIQPQCSSVNISDPDVQQQLVLSKLQMQQLFSSGTEQLKAQPWWAIWLLQLVTLETLKQCKEMTKGPIKRPKNKIHLVIFMGII